MILFRKARRRTPGVYAYRTQKHLRPWRTEWGYVGESHHEKLRDADHHGRGRYGAPAKSWSDLIVRRHVLRLPWWLGWKWVLKSLETLAILVLRPRYNWAKNPWPHKVGPREQAQQRMTRDLAPPATRRRMQVARWVDMLARTGGALIIVTGVLGWLWTR